MEDQDLELVQQGKQCMSCRFNINDGEPRVCDECLADAEA